MMVSIKIDIIQLFLFLGTSTSGAVYVNFANRRCLQNNVLFLEASTSNPFPQDPVYPPADVPSTLHRDHWRTIRTRQSRGNRVQDWYNYRLNSLNMGELVSDVERIFQDQTTVFKLNLSFGFVLFNNDTEQMQYHHSSANNNRVFETPFLVRNREDLQQVRLALENLDVFEWARQQRPNSNRIPNTRRG